MHGSDNWLGVYESRTVTIDEWMYIMCVCTKT